jgi:hypothetical protein
VDKSTNDVTGVASALHRGSLAGLSGMASFIGHAESLIIDDEIFKDERKAI